MRSTDWYPTTSFASTIGAAPGGPANTCTNRSTPTDPSTTCTTTCSTSRIAIWPTISNRWIATRPWRRDRCSRKAGGRGFSMSCSSPPAFFRNYILRGGFREGMPGLIVSAMNAHYVGLNLRNSGSCVRPPHRHRPDLARGTTTGPLDRARPAGARPPRRARRAPRRRTVPACLRRAGSGAPRAGERDRSGHGVETVEDHPAVETGDRARARSPRGLDGVAGAVVQRARAAPENIASRRVDFQLQSHAFSQWKYRQVDGFIAASNAIKDILVQDGIPAGTHRGRSRRHRRREDRSIARRSICTPSTGCRTACR